MYGNVYQGSVLNRSLIHTAKKGTASTWLANAILKLQNKCIWHVILAKYCLNQEIKDNSLVISHVTVYL